MHENRITPQVAFSHGVGPEIIDTARESANERTVAEASRTWFIYVLRDPRTNDIRYVGRTVDPKRRLYMHIWHSRPSGRKPTYKSQWIDGLASEGLEPILDVVEQCSGAESGQSEIAWIANLRAAGARLTNLTEGGDGSLGYVASAEARRKIGECSRATGRWKNWHAASVVANTGRPISAERRANLIAAHVGAKRSESTRQKISARAKGRIPSAEARAKMSLARAGKKQRPEVVAKRAAGLKKAWESDPRRRKPIDPGEVFGV